MPPAWNVLKSHMKDIIRSDLNFRPLFQQPKSTKTLSLWQLDSISSAPLNFQDQAPCWSKLFTEIFAVRAPWNLSPYLLLPKFNTWKREMLSIADEVVVIFIDFYFTIMISDCQIFRNCTWSIWPMISKYQCYLKTARSYLIELKRLRLKIHFNPTGIK